MLASVSLSLASLLLKYMGSAVVSKVELSALRNILATGRNNNNN